MVEGEDEEGMARMAAKVFMYTQLYCLCPSSPLAIADGFA